MAKLLSNEIKNHKAVITTLILCLITYWLSLQSAFIHKIEWQIQDEFIAIRANDRPPSKDIVVIDIDDHSLLALSPILGKWPWPRSVHAEIVEYLNSLDPRAILFDILFSEPDIFRPDADLYFSEVLHKSDNTFLATATHKSTHSANTPLLMHYQDTAGLIKSEYAKEDAKGLLLLPSLQSSIPLQVGSIDLLPDNDGVTRQYHIRQSLDGWQLFSLPAKASQFLGLTLPLKDSVYLDWYRGGNTPHQRLSFAEVLSQARGEQQIIPDSYFHNKVIIIGTTALGLHDLRATPINDFFPGVFILSTALNNIIDNQFLRIIPSLEILPLLLLASVVISGLFIFQLHWLAAITGCLCLLSLIIVSYVSSLQGTIIHIVPAFLAITILISGGLIYSYKLHHEKLQKTIQLFSRFMDPAFVKALLEKNTPEDLLTTKNVEVTMLFSDIRNFTSISETRTAGEMVSLLNHYFDKQVETLFKHKATLDKFIGDAVMAFWGAPLEHDQHPIYAINAALDMVDNLNGFIQEHGYEDFDIGIGIHTGNAVVGLIGSHERYDYTAIGDTVNVASRIEGLTKGRARILVSETTRAIAQDHFDFVPQGEFQVKGRSKPVKVYEPLRKMQEG